MRKPLAWNTLDEAAEWLAELTGEKWTPRRLLDTAADFPLKTWSWCSLEHEITAISIGVPVGHAVKSCLVDVGEGREEIERLGTFSAEERQKVIVPVRSIPRLSVPTHRGDLLQIMVSGSCEVCLVSGGDFRHEVARPYQVMVDPPLMATMQMLGVRQERLIELADLYTKAASETLPLPQDTSARVCPEAQVVGRQGGADNAPRIKKKESQEEREQRRFECHEAMGGKVQNVAGRWRVAGERGALAELAKKEKAAGHPYSHERDVSKDLKAEAERRRAGKALKAPFSR